MQCQQNSTNWKNEGLHGRRGDGAKVSSSVNRMRKAYYIYSIPYVGADCSHFPKRSSH